MFCRYLQERLQQLLEEKELARQSLSKYKVTIYNTYDVFGILFNKDIL